MFPQLPRVNFFKLHMMFKLSEIADRIKSEAYKLGFSHAGITSARRFPDYESRFRRWLQNSLNAEMGYLERNVDKRFDSSLLVEGARTVISLALPYGDAETAIDNSTGIALYAWGEDYHLRLRDLAQPILELLQEFDESSQSRFFVDSAPVSERTTAVMAGLGWIGRNGLLITPDRGSMLYLAEIVTTVELPDDTPFTDFLCGECRRCVDGCPTFAITETSTINASRCISYHTNTSRTAIPEDIAAKLGGRIFGCDICQQVCPWNKGSSFSKNSILSNNSYPESWPLYPEEWIGKDEVWFRRVFRGSALEKAGFGKMMGNVLASTRYNT